MTQSTETPREKIASDFEFPDHWLFLRGLGRDQRHWLGFPSTWAKRFGVKTFCLDYPGVGTEAKRSSPTSIPAIRDDVRRRWKKVKDHYKGTWGLFGHSMGGMVSTNWCTKYPEDFAHTVNLNTSAHTDILSLFKRLRPDSMKKLIRILFEKDPREREKHILEMISQKPRQRWPLEQWTEIAKKNDLKRESVNAQLLGASIFRMPKESPFKRFLFLASSKDQMVNPICSFELAKNLECELRLHPWGGHDLVLDDPEWILDQVEDYKNNPLAEHALERRLL
jgi:pimeloyl-ACP methyl ester carboxylesterase